MKPTVRIKNSDGSYNELSSNTYLKEFYLEKPDSGGKTSHYIEFDYKNKPTDGIEITLDFNYPYDDVVREFKFIPTVPTEFETAKLTIDWSR